MKTKTDKKQTDKRDTPKAALVACGAVRMVLRENGIPCKRVKFNKSDSRSTISLNSMKQMLCRLHHPRGMIIKIEIFDNLKAEVSGKNPNGKDIIKRTGTDHPFEGDIVEAIYGHSDKFIQAVINYDPDAVKNLGKVSQNGKHELKRGTYYYYDVNGELSGPVNAKTLRELAKSGEIRPKTRIETLLDASLIIDFDFEEKPE